MTARSDLVGLLDVELSVPVYGAMFDGIEVPSVVVYPAPSWLSPSSESWCAAEWRYVATFLVRRADVPGAIDEAERFVAAATYGISDLAAIGGMWEEAGDVRIETVAGVDYVAADVQYLIRQPKGATP